MGRSKIIVELIRDEISVIQAIKILKLLLQDNGNKEIMNWINKEINGYELDDELPNYRILSCNIEGIVRAGALVVSKMNIPIKEEFKESFLNFKVRQGLEKILQYSIVEKEQASHSLSAEIPLDYVNSAASLLEGEVTHAKRELGIYAFTNILNSLKPIILDIFIELEKNFGNLDDYYIDTSNKEKNEEVTQTIINIIDNSIKIGDNTKIEKSNIGEDNENKNK